MQDEEEDKSFSCRIENVKTMTDILSCMCIDLTKAQECHIEATQETLYFVVTGRSKTTQARVGLQNELFEDFFCSADSVKFVINITILIDCLHLFGAASETTSAAMSYSTHDAMFRLSLEEAGVVTTCDITSLYSEEFDELQQGLLTAFRDSPEQCQIIIKSEPLKECIQDLTESLWVGSVRFEVVEDPLCLKMSTGGTVGMSEIVIPRNQGDHYYYTHPCPRRCSDAYVSFRCSQNVAFSYPLKSLLLGMKALNVSKETYIRINGEGIMCIQHQIETSKGEDMYFDFLMVAEETELAAGDG